MVFSNLQISLQANKVPANKIIPFPTGKARDNSVPPPDSDRGHFENHHFQIRNVIGLYTTRQNRSTGYAYFTEVEKYFLR